MAALGAAVVAFAGAPASAQRFSDVTAAVLDPPFVHAGATLDVFPLFSDPPFSLPGEPAAQGWLGGVVVADFNGDGWNDIFATNGQGGANALYLNAGAPPLQFFNVAGAAGVGFPDDEAAGAVAGDFDNDGRVDLYVTNVGLFWPVAGPAAGTIFNEPGMNRLLLNQGNDDSGIPRFKDVTASARAGGTPFTRSQSAALADFDRDGDLDIFVGAHNPIVNPFFASDSTSYPFKRQASQTDLLLENRLSETGVLTFTDATDLLRDERAGALGEDGRPITDSRFSFSAAWVDFDSNGWPDLVQANDLGVIGVFRNQGGRFQYVSPKAGFENIGGWRGIAPGDINGDGYIDLFATNIGLGSGVSTYGDRRHALFLGSRDGSFTDVAQGVGLTAVAPDASLANPAEDGDATGDLGWAGRMFDFDNDGDLDLAFFGNWFSQGFGIRDLRDQAGQPLPGPFAPGHTGRGQVFENRGVDGEGALVLAPLAATAADRATLGIDNPRDARGLAVGDLDNDGFQDLVVANVSGQATTGRGAGYRAQGPFAGGLVIYHNNGAQADGTKGNSALVLRFIGGTSNRAGIGVRVTVVAAGRTQIRELRAGEGYLSAGPLTLSFGMGKAARVDLIRVDWPSGRQQSVIGQALTAPRTMLDIYEPPEG